MSKPPDSLRESQNCLPKTLHELHRTKTQFHAKKLVQKNNLCIIYDVPETKTLENSPTGHIQEHSSETHKGNQSVLLRTLMKKSSSQQVSSYFQLNLLPDFIVECIFFFLDQNDIWAVSHVCSRFRAIATRVCRKWVSSWPRKPLKEVVSLFPKIKRFKMERGGRVFPTPEHTDLGLLLKFRFLNHLDLSWCKDLTDNSAKSLFPGLKKLSSLNISFCTGVGDEGIQAFSELSDLKELNIAGCYRATNLGIKSLTDINSLTSLNISRCNRLTDEAFLSLSKLTNLVQLFAASLSQVGDTGLLALTSATKLTVLDLSGCDLLTNRGISSLSLSLPRLNTLNIDYCYRVDDLGVEVLGQLKALIKLNISHIDLLTDGGVSKLGTLIRLTSLNLSWCRNLTDTGIISALICLPLLQNLDLSGCEFLTENTAELLGNMKCLRVLNISWCKEITDQCMGYICNASTLEELSCSFCQFVSDTSVPFIISLPRLRYLDISQCPLITEYGVRVLSGVATLTRLVALSCGGSAPLRYTFLPNVNDHYQVTWEAETITSPIV